MNTRSIIRRFLALTIILSIVLSVSALPAFSSEDGPPSVVAAGPLTAFAVDTGVFLEWADNTPGALGYRVYRSRVSGEEGLSITDFMIIMKNTIVDNKWNFVDVNVDAATTYYYKLRAVLKEADPIEGEREVLSDPSDVVAVTTKSAILGGNGSDFSGAITKNVILMTIDSPYMTVNGIEQLIDPPEPGKEPLLTAPVVMNARTLVPIRAIIETIGGTVGWEDATHKITLNAFEHNVIMWLNKYDLIVNGEQKEMDVMPVAPNGRTLVPIRFAAENAGCVVEWKEINTQIILVFYLGK